MRARLVLPVTAFALGLCIWLGCGEAAASPGAFDPQAATDAYLARVSDAARERSDAYFEGGYWIQLWDFLLGLAVYGGLLRSGLSRRMRAVAERYTGSKTIHSVLYWGMYFGLTTVLLFPWGAYTGFVREHQYGLANQDFGAWLGERAIGWTLGIVIGSLAIALFYSVLRRVGRHWWLYGAALGVAFAMLGGTVAPVFISPLFNEYTALEDGPVRSAVLDMARANGIDATEVWKNDASKQSKRISANVSGMMGTERITLNDNLLERCSTAEVEAVMGHEIGHYVLNHAYESIMFFGLIILGGFAFVARGFEFLVMRHGARWGVRDVADPAGLPLIALLFSIYGFALTPVTNSYIRANEAEADLFGLNTARQPDGFAQVSLKLGEYRKLDPGAFEELLFFDHPSGRARIRMAMEWKAIYGKDVQ